MIEFTRSSELAYTRGRSAQDVFDTSYDDHGTANGAAERLLLDEWNALYEPQASATIGWMRSQPNAT